MRNELLVHNVRLVNAGLAPNVPVAEAPAGAPMATNVPDGCHFAPRRRLALMQSEGNHRLTRSATKPNHTANRRQGYDKR